jgi:hypothetical protein
MQRKCNANVTPEASTALIWKGLACSLQQHLYALIFLLKPRSAAEFQPVAFFFSNVLFEVTSKLYPKPDAIAFCPPPTAGTGGSSDGGNESRGNGDGEPAATAQSNAAKDAARAARQARMQRKRKEPEPIQEQVSRLQKRKVKNRESAARSRNRKQQYCDDLEQEVAKLSAENRALRLKLGVDLEEDMKIEVPKNTSEFPMKNRLRRTKTAPA